jgi:hypothetical protein
MNKAYVWFSIAAGLAAASPAYAAPALLQPGPDVAQDTFVYQFLPTFNFDGPGWNALFATGKTGTGHDIRGLIRFDLTGLSLDAGEIATLNLWVTDTAAAGFGVSPSPAGPVTTDIHVATSSWTASTVTWATQPTFNPASVDSEVIDGINRWVSFDVTSAVSQWLADPSSNFGFVATQRDVVNNGGRVMGVFQASAGQNRPFLQIAPIPEPAGLALLGTTAMLLVRRRRV